jgi:hypothetical protein
MPSAFTAGFFGKFFNESCYHTGYLYYDSVVKKLRTDWMIGDCESVLGSWAFLGKVDVNDAANNRIENYILGNSSSYSCNIIPTPPGNWWSPDYLQNGDYLGQAVVLPMNPLYPSPSSSFGTSVTASSPEQGIKDAPVQQGTLCDVFNTTGQFMDGYVLTYLPVSTSSTAYTPIRMDIMQGPHENYFQDFTYFNPYPTPSLPSPVFNVFPNVTCMPRRLEAKKAATPVTAETVSAGDTGTKEWEAL